MRRDREFSEYFAERAPVLRRVAFVIVQDWHSAEDVTQLAFAKLYVAWPRVRQETIDAYARKIVVNEALSLRRRHPRERLTASPPDAPDVSRSTDSPLDVGHALGLLPERQRAIVALRFIEDLSVADVAQVLGIAEGTVKSQTSRALETLRTNVSPPVLVEELP